MSVYGTIRNHWEKGHSTAIQERPACGLRLQTPRSEFAIEESEIAGALRIGKPCVEPRKRTIGACQHRGVIGHHNAEFLRGAGHVPV
jgi:hypothetical protein